MESKAVFFRGSSYLSRIYSKRLVYHWGILYPIGIRGCMVYLPTFTIKKELDVGK